MAARGSDRGRGRGHGTAMTTANSASSRGRGGNLERGRGHAVTVTAELSDHQLGQETSSDPGHGASIFLADSQKPSRPERANANHHPGQIINDAKQKRRTPQQVRDDKAKAEADAIAKKQAKQLAENRAMRQAALAEDRLRKEDIEYGKHARRPDLDMSSQGQ